MRLPRPGENAVPLHAGKYYPHKPGIMLPVGEVTDGFVVSSQDVRNAPGWSVDGNRRGRRWTMPYLRPGEPMLAGAEVADFEALVAAGEAKRARTEKLKALYRRCVEAIDAKYEKAAQEIQDAIDARKDSEGGNDV